MATAHLLFGIPGAGKTTLAGRLAERHRAVRFTPDDWMARLFGPDPPAADFATRAAALEQLLEPLWRRCLELGVDVVLDHGFWRRAERDRTRRLVEQAGAIPCLYALSCPEHEARRRVARRNRERPLGLRISAATFDVLLRRLEPLAADEDHVVVPIGPGTEPLQGHGDAQRHQRHHG